jgi:hypothetical protein
MNKSPVASGIQTPKDRVNGETTTQKDENPAKRKRIKLRSDDQKRQKGIKSVDKLIRSF